MHAELLLEIGTEEIPAGFLPKAIDDMKEIISRKLQESRVSFGPVTTMATPRRLVLKVENVAKTQSEETQIKIGPAKKVAFDENGSPTKAAIGFAKSQGMDVSQLEIVETEKGEYICARKTIKGLPTKELLPEILKNFILSIPFQKSMRWGTQDIRFARPIHWILALFDGEVVPLQLGDVSSNNLSYGHRFMSPGAFEVKNFEDYMEKTAKNYVIVDPEIRRNLILKEIERAARSVGGRPFIREDLLETVTFLVEYPTVVCGSFDPAYLKLPREVLITSMISHQKYFPVVNESGHLMPYFIVVNNTAVRNPEVVIKGNEKVLKARLADARFYFEEDQKIPLERRVDDLKKVVYHSMLGTSYEKVERFRKLAAYLVDLIDPALKATVDRVAMLAKADLDTLMVSEFPELQGVMGREYALISGEDPGVAKAIYEHYLPTTAGGELPETDAGAIVSIADKMDTIVGFFGVNLLPTGTTDPYALRRQALGIINIILNKGYPLLLDDVIQRSAEILKDRLQRPFSEVVEDVLQFFKGRLENMLINQGHPYDVVDAVISTGFADICKTVRKVEAVESFRKHPDFEALSIAFRRVSNILKDFKNGIVDSSLFQTNEEKNLYNILCSVREEVLQLIKEERFVETLKAMVKLREPIDLFFDNVLVMEKDDKIRNNRLSLLREIWDLFYGIADISKIVAV